KSTAGVAMRTILAGIAGLIFAAPTAFAAEPVDYLKQVKPLLSARCYACHGALQQKSDLRLDTAALIRQGGSRGPAIVGGNSDESLLIDAVTGTNGMRRMPPKDEGAPLSEQQVAILRAWIDQGAKAPAEPVPEDPRKHWAFRKPVRPPVPRVANTAWVRNPI